MAATVATAGCFDAAGGVDGAGVRIPWPAEGDAARYAGSPIGVTLRVAAPATVLDVEAQPVRVLPVARGFHAGDVAGDARDVEFVDAEGRRALVFAPCVSLGLFWIEGRADACRTSAASSASYIESGAPAALGVAWLWGRTLGAPGPIEMPITFAATEGRVVYDVTIETREGTRCAALVARPSPFLHLDGGIVSYAASAPLRLTVCDGESFAREVAHADPVGVLVRTELAQAAGREAWRPSDVAARAAHAAPDPLARATGRLDPFPGFEPSGFPVGEAIRAWRERDADVDRFLHASPDALLVSSLHAGVGWGEAPGAVPVIASREVRLQVRVATTSGESFGGELIKRCDAGVCRTALLRSSAGRACEAPCAIEAAALRVPVGELLERANRSMGVSAAYADLLLSLPGYEGPISTGGHYLYRVTAVPESDHPYPHETTLDGTTGKLLLLQAPNARVEQRTGVARDDWI